MPDRPKSAVLRFDPALPKKALQKVRDNVSAIVIDRDQLWLGGDEGTSVHRMTRDASGDFGRGAFGIGGRDRVDAASARASRSCRSPATPHSASSCPRIR